MGGFFFLVVELANSVVCSKNKQQANVALKARRYTCTFPNRDLKSSMFGNYFLYASFSSTTISLTEQ
jgi:hypothetical protein